MADRRPFYSFPLRRREFGALLLRLLILAATFAAGGCANVVGYVAELNLDLTVTRAGQPAPLQRFIIWIDEKRLEKLTDREGHITLTEDYPWDAQTLDVPGLGPMRHSPAPAVELRLYGDADHPIEGRRTLVKLPNNAWKLSIVVDLPPS